MKVFKRVKIGGTPCGDTVLNGLASEPVSYLQGYNVTESKGTVATTGNAKGQEQEDCGHSFYR